MMHSTDVTLYSVSVRGTQSKALLRALRAQSNELGGDVLTYVTHPNAAFFFNSAPKAASVQCVAGKSLFASPDALHAVLRPPLSNRRTPHGTHVYVGEGVQGLLDAIIARSGRSKALSDHITAATFSICSVQ